MHAQSRLNLCDPMDSSPPDSSVHGILQARTLEWVVTSFSRGLSWIEPTSPMSPSLAARFFTTEPPGKGRRGLEKQHVDLGRPSLYLQHPSSHHNQWFCPSAEPSWGCTLMRELGQEQFYLIQILRQGILLVLELSLSMHRQEGES